MTNVCAATGIIFFSTETVDTLEFGNSFKYNDFIYQARGYDFIYQARGTGRCRDFRAVCQLTITNSQPPVEVHVIRTPGYGRNVAVVASEVSSNLIQLRYNNLNTNATTCH